MPFLTADAMDNYYPRQRDQMAVDFTDMPLYDIPAGADGSISSPTSPTFPSFNTTYQLPPNPDWFSWNHPKIEALSPEFPSTESFDSSVYPTRYTMSMSGSPVVNPLDLAKHTPDLAFSHGDDLHGPLFETVAPQEGRGVVSKARRTNNSVRRQQGSEPLSPSSDEPRYPSRKRKSLASVTDSAISSPRSSLAASPPPPASRRASNLGQSPAAASGPGPKKTAHNMIEKRYRNNLNDKITALRDAVPTLRIAAQRLEGGPVDETTEIDDEFAEEMGPLPPVQKLNKATILSKAAEYIVFLEKKNKALREENAEFRRKAEAEKDADFSPELWS